MSPDNRPGGRSRRTVSGGGNVYRRGSGLGGGSVGGNPAEQACLRDVARTTGNSQVTVLGSEFS